MLLFLLLSFFWFSMWLSMHCRRRCYCCCCRCYPCCCRCHCCCCCRCHCCCCRCCCCRFFVGIVIFVVVVVFIVVVVVVVVIVVVIAVVYIVFLLLLLLFWLFLLLSGFLPFNQIPLHFDVYFQQISHFPPTNIIFSLKTFLLLQILGSSFNLADLSRTAYSCSIWFPPFQKNIFPLKLCSAIV